MVKNRGYDFRKAMEAYEAGMRLITEANRLVQSAIAPLEKQLNSYETKPKKPVLRIVYPEE